MTTFPPPFGNSGTKPSFLAKCWAEALPSRSGTLGELGNPRPESIPDACSPSSHSAPKPPGSAMSPGKLASSPLCSRVPGQPCLSNSWGADAEYVYWERLGIADDLGIQTSPGSEGWLVAIRESKLACTCSDTSSVVH
jgi:hypothetical protein